MKLSIAYINDVHGYLEPHAELFYEAGKEIVETAGGYARIATVINNIRLNNSNTLLFDGGDTFHGTLPIVESKGETLIPILNKLAIGAMVGHWDFGYGPKQLKKLTNLLNYPFLGINVYNEDNTLFLLPYTFIQVEDLRIAVIGICSNIIDKTMPKHFSEGLKITDGLEELMANIKKVREEGAEMIILLSHNGFPQDVEMLNKIEGIDVCLSAHTHNRLYDVVKINNAIVIQCGCHGSFLGHLQLSFENKKIVKSNYELITIGISIKEDEQIKKLVNEIMKPYQFLKHEIVGRTEILLHRYNTIASTMDDLLLSAIKSVNSFDVAFSNGWRYGVPIDVGNITKWDLYNIIPMNPEISEVEMTGDEIVKMLEENLERTFCEDAMKQMGGYVKRCLGLNIKMRVENPKGYRIQQIFIGNEPLIKEQTYKVVFVTSQGVPKKLGKNRKHLSIKAVEAMEVYLKENPIYKATTLNTFSLV